MVSKPYETLTILFQDCKMFLNLWKMISKLWKVISKLWKVFWIPEKKFCISEEIPPRHCTVFRQHLFRVSTSSETQFQNMHFGTFLPAYYFAFHVWNIANSWLIIKASKPWKLFSISENIFCETESWFWISNKCFETLKKSLVSLKKFGQDIVQCFANTFSEFQLNQKHSFRIGILALISLHIILCLMCETL